MFRDPIVEEVRAVRDAIAREYDYDVKKLADALREEQRNVDLLRSPANPSDQGKATVSSNRRVYEELRQATEVRRGSMRFLRHGSRWGAWEVCLDGKHGRFESNGSGFPELDRLYAPKPVAKTPRHWKDYSRSLVPGAIEELIRMLA